MSPRSGSAGNAIKFGLAAGSTLAAFTSIVGFGVAGWAFWAMVLIGAWAGAEVIAILLILRTWRADVASAWHALRLRRGGTLQGHRLLKG